MVEPRKTLRSRLTALLVRDDDADWGEVRRSALRYGFAVLAPALAALLAYGLMQLLGTTRLSFLFLASVLCVGVLLGMRPAIVSALVASAFYNFYLVEPRYSFRLASAEDFDALFVFLVAAAAVGAFVGRLRDEAEASKRRLSTTQALFEASNRLSTAVRLEEIDEAMAESAARALDAPAVIVRAGKITAQSGAGHGTLFEAGEEAALLTRCAAFVTESEVSSVSGRWRIALMRGRGSAHGAVAVACASGRRAADDERTLSSLAGLGAVALDRSLLVAEMAEAEALAESERLRTALLSSVSHDFRTPLAAILASSTSLLEYGPRLDEVARADLARSIREESERMNRYVANLLDMTRLEAGALKPRLTNVEVLDVVAVAVSHLAREAASKRVELTHGGAAVFSFVDPVLLEQALVNVVENAVALTPPGGRVAVDVSGSGERGAVIAVTDDGPGIPPEALSRVFDKFFRGQGHRERAGAGLGLSIAKGLIEAMGGAIEAESPLADGHGARFVFRLRPQALEEIAA